jgi:hypothetical protein
MRYRWLIAFAALQLWAADPKPLAIQRITLSQFEDGPGIPGGYQFVAGETIFFSFQVSGYKPVGDEEPRVSLAYTIEAQDPAGVPILEPVSANVDTTLDSEDKQWMPKVRLTISLPPHAPGGEYRISMIVRDRVAQTQVTGETKFRVKAPAFTPSDKLVIRDFDFYRGEDDQKPMGEAVYRGGDTLWARFYITGYQFGPKNALEVGYGLAVLRPNGETMFRQEDAAVEKQESFYPRRFLPATMSLNLDKDLKPGTYTLVVLSNDKIGKQTVELKSVFRVE